MDKHLKFILAMILQSVLGAILALCLMLAIVAIGAFYNAPTSFLQRILMIILLGFAVFIGFLLGRESAKKGMWPPRDKADTGTDFDVGS
jgi:lipopolysaccharide export LptBFGC system permease protein LptF